MNLIHINCRNKPSWVWGSSWTCVLRIKFFFPGASSRSCLCVTAQIVRWRVKGREVKDSWCHKQQPGESAMQRAERQRERNCCTALIQCLYCNEQVGCWLKTIALPVPKPPVYQKNAHWRSLFTLQSFVIKHYYSFVIPVHQITRVFSISKEDFLSSEPLVFSLCSTFIQPLSFWLCFGIRKVGWHLTHGGCVVVMIFLSWTVISCIKTKGRWHPVSPEHSEHFGFVVLKRQELIHYVLQYLAFFFFFNYISHHLPAGYFVLWNTRAAARLVGVEVGWGGLGTERRSKSARKSDREWKPDVVPWPWNRNMERVRLTQSALPKFWQTLCVFHCFHLLFFFSLSLSVST